jgi:large subunit ribosomal protein L20
MARVKRGTTKLKRRHNVLARTKGMRGNIRKKERQATEVLAHAGNHAFQHRRKKKGDFRTLWNVRLNAALRPLGFTYSTFIAALKQKNIALNRKVLSELAADEPAAFERLVAQVK